MTLRPRYIRGLAAASTRSQATPPNWVTSVLAVVRRYPVLTLEGVASMDDKTLNEHLVLLVGEQR
jgi:hypothetical protein